MKLVIELPGEPRGKGRPRFAKGHVYTPATTASYERALAWAAKIAMGGRKPFTGPLKVSVTAFMGIPPSWKMTRHLDALAGVIRPTGKPDADNVLKIATDSCNKILYLDDSQIVTATVSKLYAATPALRVEVETLFESSGKESELVLAK
jgi:Holliday junction resolvase RusA-like endonuclease